MNHGFDIFIQCDQPAEFVDFNPDEKYFISVNNDLTVQIRSAENGEYVSGKQYAGYPKTIHFNSDGRYFAVITEKLF